MKRCPSCGETKPSEDFHKCAARKDGLQSECKSCRCDRAAAMYAADPDVRERHYVNGKAHRKRVRKNLVDYLLAHPCVDCGETDPVVLDFDHLSDKTQTVGEMVAKGARQEKILAEISKCEVVCANCHRRRTAKRHGGWAKSIPQEALIAQ